MASRIQGITVEIGGDTTKLQTALKGLNGEIKSTARRLGIEKRKYFDSFFCGNQTGQRRNLANYGQINRK